MLAMTRRASLKRLRLGVRTVIYPAGPSRVRRRLPTSADTGLTPSVSGVDGGSSLVELTGS